MPENFHDRLLDYYLNVGKILRGEAEASAIFPNSTDKGMSRERIYREFLLQHAPSKCNVYFGGFGFGFNGQESKQLDVLITTDTTPKFNLHNPNGDGKSFSPVEGTLAIASVKSTLDKKELFDALDGVASIPATESLDGRVSFGMSINNYDDWPFKIIYASNGINLDSLFAHLESYYEENPKIPLGRRPNLIHVAGKYLIIRKKSYDAFPGQVGSFYTFNTEPDLQAIVWTIDGIQQNASASTHIIFKYADLGNQIMNRAEARLQM